MMPTSQDEVQSSPNGETISNVTIHGKTISNVIIQISSAEDALDDVHTRYIVNMPDEDFEDANRIFFQLEQAWWFYDDFYCDNDASLPRYPSLKPFAKKMFSWSPLLQSRQSEFNALWSAFMKYKNTISTYGTILLNKECTHIVLCQTFGGKSWTVPSGKVNPGETGVLAGARETYEETGFDPNCHLGLTKKMKHEAGLSVATTGPDGLPTTTVTDEMRKQMAEEQFHSLGWYPLQEEDALTYVEAPSGKRRTCYVCHGVPMDFPFAPVCRKEIGLIQWHPISDIPKKSFAVVPFIKQLRRWIKRQTKSSKRSRTPNHTPQKERNQKNTSEFAGADSKPRSNSEGCSIGSGTKNKPDPNSSVKKKKKKKTANDVDTGSYSRGGSRSGSTGRNRGSGTVKETDDIVKAGLASPGDLDRWSEEDMFAVNEKLIGRQIKYDGNPHKFVSDNEDGMACHRFHVVGGTFMNSDAPVGGFSLAPPPAQSRLQPLFQSQERQHENHEDDILLQPFFTDAGMTPWGERVPEVPTSTSTSTPIARVEATKTLDAAFNKNEHRNNSAEPLMDLLTRHGSSALVADETDGDGTQCDLFLTDKEITNRSQAVKAAVYNIKEESPPRVYADLEFMKSWVERMRPEPPPPSESKNVPPLFKFDMGPILEALHSFDKRG